ncbi:MAG TPA: hypothetical protein VG123_22430 [Streptosporangiaceae bacterium]|jgi:hypothetical protein|nr:hypothetical protein [Streptosporangiaceae bacterium]
METLIGFIAGYLAGSQDGKAGLERVKKSLAAIRSSPELRRVAMEGTSLAAALLKQATSRGLAGTVGDVTELLTNRGNQHSRAA